MDARFNHYDATTGQMCFSNALLCIKRGKSVARVGWNGKGMGVALVKASQEPWPKLVYFDGNNDGSPLSDFIAMKTATGQVVPWLASQSDLLAEDWIELV